MGLGSTTSTDRGNIYGSGTQGQSGGLELLGEELAEPSHRGHSVYRPSAQRPRRRAATASALHCRSRPPGWRRAHFSPVTSPESLPLSGQTPKTLAQAEPQRPASSSQFQATVQTSVPESLLGHHPVGVKPPFTLEIMRNQHLPPDLLSDKRQQTYRSSRNLARFLLRRVKLKFEVPAMISTDQVITVDPKAAHLASTLELLGTTSLPDLPDCKW